MTSTLWLQLFCFPLQELVHLSILNTYLKCQSQVQVLIFPDCGFLSHNSLVLLLPLQHTAQIRASKFHWFWSNMPLILTMWNGQAVHKTDKEVITVLSACRVPWKDLGGCESRSGSRASFKGHCWTFSYAYGASLSFLYWSIIPKSGNYCISNKRFNPYMFCASNCFTHFWENQRGVIYFSIEWKKSEVKKIHIYFSICSLLNKHTLIKRTWCFIVKMSTLNFLDNMDKWNGNRQSWNLSWLQIQLQRSLCSFER